MDASRWPCPRNVMLSDNKQGDEKESPEREDWKMENTKKVQRTINDVFERKNTPYKEVKDFLYKVRDAERNVQNIVNRIEYRQEMVSAFGVKITEAPKMHGYSGSVIEKAVVEIDTLKSELDAAKKKLVITRYCVSRIISKLDNPNQEMILTERYLESKDWDEIAEKMKMTKAAVQKAHGRAMPPMEAILKKEDTISMLGERETDETEE